jgi:hypothetical protein
MAQINRSCIKLINIEIPMKTKIIAVLLIALSISFIRAQDRGDYPDFNQTQDLILAQYDCGGDPDDTQCVAAFGSLKAHPSMAGVTIHGVLGASSGFSPKDNTPLFNLAFGERGVDWSHCQGESQWQPQVHEVRDKIMKQWSEFPEAGIWIAEGGQSGFTLAVVNSLLALNNPNCNEARIKNYIHVVQHSSTNEKYTDSTDLEKVKELCDYIKIDDGNWGGNGTPDYESNGDGQKDGTFFEGHLEVPFHRALLNSAMSDMNKNEYTRALWSTSDKLIDSVYRLTATYSCIPGPSKELNYDRSALDFSDHVATMWILSPGKGGTGINPATYYSIEAYFHCYVLTEKNPAVAGTTRLEAENDISIAGGNSIQVGGSVASDPSASGGKYITQQSNPKAAYDPHGTINDSRYYQPLKVSWAFNTTGKGKINLKFSYRSKEGSLCKMAVLLNGVTLKQNGHDVILQTTETSWQERSVSVTGLPAGTHVVEVGETGTSNKNPLEIDFIELSLPDPPGTTDRKSVP